MSNEHEAEVVSSQQFRCNPSCYVITDSDEDWEATFRLAQSEDQSCTLLLPGGATPPKMSSRERLNLIFVSLEKWGRVYASYYSPGAFWEEEVFVCPQCAHATNISDWSDEERGEFYCKYCYSTWQCSSNQGLYRVKALLEDEE